MEVVSLSSLLKAADEEAKVCEYLSSFICVNNKDVESFLHRKAINNENSNLSRTSLFIDKKSDKIMGYFTLLIKNFKIVDNVSKTSRKSLTHDKNALHFNTILIAQLGRSDEFKHELSGATILNVAMEICERIYELTALQIVSVEHTSHPKLDQFYLANQFKPLQTNSTGNVLSILKLS